MVTENNFRQYLRLSPDDSEPLEGFIEAAKVKAMSAGVREQHDNQMYDQFVLQFAGMLYESRSMDTADLDPAKVQTIMSSFLLPLRYSGGI